MVGDCIGTGREEIADVVVECRQRKLVEDMVVGWATIVAADSLNIQSIAGTVSARTLSLKFCLRDRRKANR